jgi:HAD superfamily hydrolase (TIGR01509 family)
VTVKLIIFDCDGTLVDSEPLGNLALAQVLTEHGYPISADEAMRQFKGRKLADCLAGVEADAGFSLPAAFEPEFRQRMAQMFDRELTAIPGALELIEGVSIEFCIASSGPRKKIEHSLGLTGLLPFFQERIFSAYEIEIWKPDPGMFLHVAKTYEVAPDECIVIEDSKPGIIAGIEAGMQVLALGSDGLEFGHHDQLTSFAELFAIHDHLHTLGLATIRDLSD